MVVEKVRDIVNSVKTVLTPVYILQERGYFGDKDNFIKAEVELVNRFMGEFGVGGLAAILSMSARGASYVEIATVLAVSGLSLMAFGFLTLFAEYNALENLKKGVKK